MALNFSHRPIFPGHLSEENSFSSMSFVNGHLLEGMPEQNLDTSWKTWISDQDMMEDWFAYGRNRCDTAGLQEAVSEDILDRLPSDPFGMDISTTVTTITGLLENLIRSNAMWHPAVHSNYGVACGSDVHYPCGWNLEEREVGEMFSSHDDFGLNFCNVNFSPSGPQTEDSDGGAHHEALNFGLGYLVGNLEEREIRDVSSSHDDFGLNICNVNFGPQTEDSDGGAHHEAQNFSLENFNPSGLQTEDSDGGAHHEALNFALGYLGVRDLLSVEGVCRTLHSTVRGDPFYWRNIHIEQSLNDKITDDILLQLTNLAQGNLQCLSLEGCLRITDDGLRRVLECNPRLTKLSVPGCTRLSIQGVLNTLKTFNSISPQGLKRIRIGGLYGVTTDHFEELNILLGTDTLKKLQHAHNPHIFNRRNMYVSCEDERAIDIEMCPMCQNLRLLYDCPIEDCQVNKHVETGCRACIICIRRCVHCGRCIKDYEYEETFCLECLCLDCGKQLKRDQEME